MQICKNKTAAIMIALMFVISIGTSVIFVQTTSAHGPGQGGAPWQIPTHAYVIALPDPVGVGQKTTIYMFLGNLPFDGAALNNDYRYRNYNLTITAPDGTVQTQNFSYISDPTNSQYFPYTPNQVGTYILNFTYGGQNINDYDHANDAYVNDTYMPVLAQQHLLCSKNLIIHYRQPTGLDQFTVKILTGGQFLQTG